VPSPKQRNPDGGRNALRPLGGTHGHSHLLVVVDDPNQRELYTRRLARMGYAVLSTSGGEEALEIPSVNPIEVLITDYQMPGMDGCEIISRVRQS
jgi:CheY-like chemotaxis protein